MVVSITPLENTRPVVPLMCAAALAEAMTFGRAVRAVVNATTETINWCGHDAGIGIGHGRFTMRE